MAKIQRSIRIDDSVFEWIDRYNNLRYSAGMRKLSAGDVMLDAVREYLTEHMVELKQVIAAQASGVDQLMQELKNEEKRVK